MLFGQSILSNIPADWEVIGGSITDSLINLSAGGYATTEIHTTDISSIPEAMQLNIISDNYANTYVPSITAILHIETEDNLIYEYTVPICDTKNGICTVEIPMVTVDFTLFRFTFKSSVAVIFSSWSLAGPITDIVDLTEVEAKIAKLLYDYNTSTYTITQQEETIGIISARLSDNTDISGHLNLAYEASESTIITLRFKDNQATELFAPLIYDVKIGRGSISVPHSYLKRLTGIHNLSVTAQCSKGSLILHTRSVLFTVDAGYMATRLMSIGTDIQDIALQKLPTENSPSSIYAIGIDNDDIIRVRSRPYSENADVAWQAVYNLEEGLSAAIEFNGTWRRDIGIQYFSLDCETDPWIFWVTTNNDLKAQRGLNTDTLTILASGVSFVCAIKGFQAALYPSNDQGLICAYLKDGNAYYRNYCTQTNGTTVLWEEERALTQLGTDITYLHIHRLNDYRIGFVSSTPTGNHWLISKRTYITAATPTEIVPIDLVPNYTTMAIIPNGTPEYAQPEVALEIKDNWIDLYVHCQYPVILRNTFNEAFDIVATNNAQIKSVVSEGTSLHITLVEKATGGNLILTPRPNIVVAVLSPYGYINMPVGSSWLFEFIIRNNYEDTINLDINSEVMALTQPLRYNTYVAPNIDTINLNLVPEVSANTLPIIYSTQSQPVGTVELNLNSVVNTIITFVGTLPI